MDVLPKNQIDFITNHDANQRKREALENAHGNFVEPYINAMIPVNSELLPRIAPPGFYFVSAWLVLILIYCGWMRSKPPIK
ncbi:MAG: hypothetical protein HC916_03370 [Coleofasciculaceae cyanobacterium SM2_1_6]|nr:hypothetical protein [Coleofasciculaceae cyanobacterium SM2_1_6]